SVKRAFDPAGSMNPGKVLPAAAGRAAHEGVEAAPAHAPAAPAPAPSTIRVDPRSGPSGSPDEARRAAAPGGSAPAAPPPAASQAASLARRRLKRGRHG